MQPVLLVFPELLGRLDSQGLQVYLVKPVFLLEELGLLGFLDSLVLLIPLDLLELLDLLD